MAKLCQFLKSPSAPEHFELKDGIEFENGFFEGYVAIKKLVIFPQLIYVDTAVSTDASKEILLGLLNWARETHGIAFEEAMIHRWAFVNDVVFKTDFPLLEVQNPILNSIGERIEAEVENNLKEKLVFTPAEFKISHDPNKRSGGIASFTLSYRANTPFEDNVFYSEAPVPTPLHLKFLEGIEAEFRKIYESR